MRSGMGTISQPGRIDVFIRNGEIVVRARGRYKQAFVPKPMDVDTEMNTVLSEPFLALFCIIPRDGCTFTEWAGDRIGTVVSGILFAYRGNSVPVAAHLICAMPSVWPLSAVVKTWQRPRHTTRDDRHPLTFWTGADRHQHGGIVTAPI